MYQRKVCLMLALTFTCILLSTDRVSGEGVRLYYHKKPIELEEMKDHEKTPFARRNFETIKRGMTETEVLDLLGKPLGLKKVKRRKNRWTVTYTYPDQHVVNFKNGLVVGKVKR